MQKQYVDHVKKEGAKGDWSSFCALGFPRVISCIIFYKDINVIMGLFDGYFGQKNKIS